MVVLKQYGEQRTGTNYLRALLLANYRNVLPLMHVLGDKHSPPLDLPAYWEKIRGQPAALLQFVTSCTWAAPAETTRPDDAGQLRHMRQVAEAMTDSFRPEQLGFLISVKHPYAWAVSLARYSNWLGVTGGVARMGREHRNSLEAACHVYNQRHAAWLELHRRAGRRSLLVRYEKLLEEPRGMVSLMARTFGLLLSGPEPVQVQDRTAPTHWDDHPVTFEPIRFDPTPYRDRNYEKMLDDELWAVVTETIDWDLAAEFGYHKRHFRRSACFRT